MSRLLVVVVVVVAACGGGANFDRSAVSDALGDKTNGELLNLGEDLCNEASDNVYAMTLAMLMDDDQIGSVTAQAVGCPDRYEAVADEMGWPKP